MAVTKQKKEEIFKGLVDKFGKSQSVVFADYRGLDVAGISDLRKKLRDENAEMKVAKKTLISLAAKESKIDDLTEAGLEGPVVATFSYEDPLSGIKVLFNFAKTNSNLKLLGGIIDGKVVGADVIQQYARLPGHDELIAQLIGSMNAPLSGFVGIGNSLIGGIVRVLNAYKDSMPATAETAPISDPVESSAAEESEEEEVNTGEAN